MTLGVVFRAFGSSLVWYDEVASVMLAWLTFYGSALASVKRAHIGCPELVELRRRACARVLAIVAQLLVIAFFALLGWTGVIDPADPRRRLAGQPARGLDGFVQSVIPVSAVLIVVAELTHAGRRCSRPATRSAPRPGARRRPALRHRHGPCCSCSRRVLALVLIDVPIAVSLGIVAVVAMLASHGLESLPNMPS